MSRPMRKRVLSHMRTTKTQIRLRGSNNKDADQPAHLRSLISTFVVRCRDSVMSLVSVTKISSLMLASVAEQASLSLTWSETPEDTVSRDEAHGYLDQSENVQSKSSCVEARWLKYYRENLQEIPFTFLYTCSCYYCLNHGVQHIGFACFILQHEDSWVNYTRSVYFPFS